MSEKMETTNLPTGAFDSGNPVFDAIVHILAANAASGRVDWCKEDYARTLHRVLNDIYLAEPAIPMRRTTRNYEYALNLDSDGNLRNRYFGIHPDSKDDQQNITSEE